MATQLSPNAYSTKAPDFDSVKNFFAKVKSVISKLVPRRNKQEESYDTYLTIAENIRQRRLQEQLQSQLLSYSHY